MDVVDYNFLIPVSDLVSSASLWDAYTEDEVLTLTRD